MGAEVKRFGKTVRAMREAGMLTGQQARTLVGQARHGELPAARRGLEALMSRRSCSPQPTGGDVKDS